MGSSSAELLLPPSMAPMWEIRRLLLLPVSSNVLHDKVRKAVRSDSSVGTNTEKEVSSLNVFSM